MGRKTEPTKKKKSTTVKPLLHKGSKARKFLNTAVSVIGGPAVMAYNQVKKLNKTREKSGMGSIVKFKKGGLIQHD